MSLLLGRLVAPHMPGCAPGAAAGHILGSSCVPPPAIGDARVFLPGSSFWDAPLRDQRTIRNGNEPGNCPGHGLMRAAGVAGQACTGPFR
jgi:hypothetical protein